MTGGSERPVALALRALGLGDFVTGLPALGLLKAALPDHEVVLAAPAVFAPLVPLIPAVDRLLPAAELAPVSPVPDRLDVAIDLHGNGPASRRLLSVLRPRRLYGFADPAGTLPGPTWLAAEHEVSRWCRLVGEVLPVPDGPADTRQAVLDGPADTRQAVLDGPADTRQAVHCMRLPSAPVPESVLDGPADTRQAVPDGPADTRQAVPNGPADTRQAVTVVHPGAAAPSRRWPAERFAEVAAALRRQGHSVVVTGGPAERALARTVARHAGVPVLDELTLLELVSLIGRARLVVCGDTGVAHLASNYRTPSVLLFGPVSPAVWGPPAGGPHRVLWHGDGTGDPHGQQPDPALLAITVSEVLAAAGELVPSEAALPA